MHQRIQINFKPLNNAIKMPFMDGTYAACTQVEPNHKATVPNRSTPILGLRLLYHVGYFYILMTWVQIDANSFSCHFLTGSYSNS